MRESQTDVDTGVTTVLLEVDTKHMDTSIEREIGGYAVMPAKPSLENELTVDPNVEAVVASASQGNGRRFR